MKKLHVPINNKTNKQNRPPLTADKTKEGQPPVFCTLTQRGTDLLIVYLFLSFSVTFSKGSSENSVTKLGLTFLVCNPFFLVIVA